MSRQIHSLGVLLDMPKQRRTAAMLKDVRLMQAGGSKAIIPVVGDCMERQRIVDGGWVAVDFAHMPRVPRYGAGGYVDACLCLAAPLGRNSPEVMVKAYSGKWGQVHMVSTRYDNWKGGDYIMDYGLAAKEIFGVVFASWDRDGQLLWERDPAGFPEALECTTSINGVNVGEPDTAKGLVMA